MDGANSNDFKNDFKLVRQTIESIVIGRPEPTEETPQGMCMDKGYDYKEVRQLVAEFGFTAHIKTRSEEAKALTKPSSRRPVSRRAAG